MLRAVSIFFLASTVPVHAEFKDWSGGYYCKITASVGVEYNKNTNDWSGAIFNPSDAALMLSVEATGNIAKSSSGPVPTYLVRVKRLGENYEAERCAINGSNLHVPVDLDGSGSCSNRFNYRFNLMTLKLQVSYDGSFMDDSTTSFDPAFIAVAQCERAS